MFQMGHFKDHLRETHNSDDILSHFVMKLKEVTQPEDAPSCGEYPRWDERLQLWQVRPRSILSAAIASTKREFECKISPTTQQYAPLYVGVWFEPIFRTQIIYVYAVPGY